MSMLGLQNNFTCGEICQDAWDRTDIQPVQKGVELATNFVCGIAGPLIKRRGFWNNGAVMNPAVMGRIIPFRKSINDALMLELGDGQMRVWSADGSPLLNGANPPAPYQVATPWTAAEVQTLRWKQIGDVIYFVSSLGLRPYTLERQANTDWVFTPIAFTNGPWRTENPTTGPTLTLSGAARNLVDTNAASGAASIQQNSPDVTVTASTGVFTPGHVGSNLRVRTGDGPQGASSWSPSAPSAGISYTHGQFALSNSRLYLQNSGKDGNSGNTPPVHETGTVSDGALEWTYIHDGAGILLITAFISPTEVTATAVTNLPLGNGQSTTYWSEAAYSDLRGWPRAWPAMREERLVLASTATDVDFVDLTQTAGFTPTTADFTPGTGTGTVIDTNAVRRRCGDDGSPIVWLATNTYLVAGSETADFLIAGSVLDEPITPSAVLDKQQILFGAEDAAPAMVWDGLIYIEQGGLSLRELVIDGGQNKQSEDLTVLATHIGARVFEELAWCRQDQTLWSRLGDGGLAAYVYHKEQQVQGWFSQQLAGGFAVEWMAVIPGEDKLDTLWLQVSRVVNGQTQRFLWMQSAPADALYYDGAALYEGAAVSTVTGLDAYDGQAVSVMAGGVESPGLPVSAGAVTLPRPATVATVGLPYVSHFVSLKLDMQQKMPGGTLLTQQSLVGALVSMLTAKCTVGGLGGQPTTVLTRTTADIPGVKERPTIQQCKFTADTSRDPRVEIIDATGYDCRIYSIRPELGT